MTIDERLEALTHTVELMAERMDALGESLESVAKMQQQTERQIRRVGRYVRLVATMVMDHESRLLTLEGEEDKDEEEGKPRPE